MHSGERDADSAHNIDWLVFEKLKCLQRVTSSGVKVPKIEKSNEETNETSTYKLSSEC